MEKKTKVTTVLTIIVAALIVMSMASCTPKYGCQSTEGMSGYGPYQPAKSGIVIFKKNSYRKP